MRSIFRPALLIATLTGCFAAALAAPTPASSADTAAAPASVTGRLIDPLDVVISNIDTSVVLKNTSSDQIFKADVRGGKFLFSSVPAGTYDVDVPIPCCMYRSYQQKALTLAAGQALTIDLHVGFGMNLGTIGDDPGALGADMRAKTKHPETKAPRLKNGQPDLSGVWYVILDPTAALVPRIPMQPWAMDMQQKLYQQLGPAAATDPGTFCLPSNATPTRLLFPWEFIQGEKKIVQVGEFYTPGQRIIYMDGRKHPDLNAWNPAWYGHSVGHWEKDTLVIDSVGFTETATGYGIHSEKLHVVERISRPTYGSLIIDITADDTDAWTGPFHQVVKAGLAEGEDTQEFVCAENNKDPLHIGGLGWKGRP
jgi:hypothetical protein